MLNSTLRRAARVCPNATLPTRQSTVSNTSTITASFSTRTHQRRYSSSKPPIPPNNGSPTIPANTVKQVGAPRTTEKRPGAESRLSRRRTTKSEKTETIKQAQESKDNEWAHSLPSVPSTQYLNPKDVYVASFFATHRPLSITGPLPPETQLDNFDKIFQPQSKKSKARNVSADVIYTLNNVVQHLDEQVQNQQESQAVEQKADLIKMLTQHNHAAQQQNQSSGHPHPIRTSGNVKLAIEEIAKRFRPFNTPPAPVPVPELEFYAKPGEVEAERQAENDEEFLARQLETDIEGQDSDLTYAKVHATRTKVDLKTGQFFTPRVVVDISDPSTVAAIEEIIDPSSSIPKSEQSPATIGGRSKRGMYVDPKNPSSGADKYYAISVKRQRKLKMKKHKYKKLMRKTRNLRRRLDKV